MPWLSCECCTTENAIYITTVCCQHKARRKWWELGCSGIPTELNSLDFFYIAIRAQFSVDRPSRMCFSYAPDACDDHHLSPLLCFAYICPWHICVASRSERMHKEEWTREWILAHFHGSLAKVGTQPRSCTGSNNIGKVDSSSFQATGLRLPPTCPLFWWASLVAISSLLVTLHMDQSSVSCNIFFTNLEQRIISLHHAYYSLIRYC